MIVVCVVCFEYSVFVVWFLYGTFNGRGVSIAACVQLVVCQAAGLRNCLARLALELPSGTRSSCSGSGDLAGFLNVG